MSEDNMKDKFGFDDDEILGPDGGVLEGSNEQESVVNKDSAVDDVRDSASLDSGHKNKGAKLGFVPLVLDKLSEFDKRTYIGAAVVVFGVTLLTGAYYFKDNLEVTKAFQMPKENSVVNQENGNKIDFSDELIPAKSVAANNKLYVEDSTLKYSENADLDGRIIDSLLGSYATKEELATRILDSEKNKTSQKELDVYLVATKYNSSEIDSLKRMIQELKNSNKNEGVEEILSVVKDIKDSLSETNKKVDELVDRVVKLEKNAGWYHNRISSLEAGNAGSSPSSKAVNTANNANSSKRVDLKGQSAWVVNGASNNVAFIQNKHTGSKLRVTRGFDVPSCGQVTDINPTNKSVTTVSCLINN